ncbi:MAG: citrate/2-methylcitrate synthase [Marinobacter sp.]
MFTYDRDYGTTAATESLIVLSRICGRHAPHHREIIAYRLTSKMPILAAMYYIFGNSRNDLDYARNLLHMMIANRCETKPLLTKAMDKIFILHPDHEQNDPTSTV